jgi:hypothetical protein
MEEGTDNIIVSAGFNVRDKLESRTQIVVGFTSSFDCVENGVIKNSSLINQKIFMNKEGLTLRDLDLNQPGEAEVFSNEIKNYFLLRDQLTNNLKKINSCEVFYLVCKFKIPDSNEYYFSVKTLHEVTHS